MDTLTFQVLVALRDGPGDGNSLLAGVTAQGESSGPSLPTLYRCLRSCLDAGWIEGSAAPADSGPGRPPQVYRLTAPGAGQLTAEAERHQRLAALVLEHEPAAKADR